jgi:hypothetical protein
MTGRVRAVQERRRSGAAGPHSRRPTRAEEKAQALADDPVVADLPQPDDEDQSCADPRTTGEDEETT